MISTHTNNLSVYLLICYIVSDDVEHLMFKWSLPNDKRVLLNVGKPYPSINKGEFNISI